MVAGAWYAAQVRCKRERVVSLVLCAKGYETFVPLCRPNVRSSVDFAAPNEPLFPGYVFFRMSDEDDHGVKVVTTPGVLAIVGIGRKPVPLEHDEIEALRAAFLYELGMQPIEFFEAGHKVRIEDGPLAGVVGVIVHAKNLRRLVLSVTLLQRSVSVEIPVYQVSLLRASSATPRSVAELPAKAIAARAGVF